VSQLCTQFSCQRTPPEILACYKVFAAQPYVVGREDPERRPASSSCQLRRFAGVGRRSDDLLLCFCESRHFSLVGQAGPLGPGGARDARTPCNDFPDSCTSGTSFSAPIVAGIAARYLQNNPSATRDQVLSFIQSESSTHTGVQVYEPATGASVPLAAMTDCQ